MVDTPPQDEAPEIVEARLHLAVGKFMLRFADTDVYLNSELRRYTIAKLGGDPKLIEPVVRAIIDPMRPKALRQTFKRVLKVTNIATNERERTEKALDHIAEIQGLRDDLAHQASRPSWWTSEVDGIPSDHLLITTGISGRSPDDVAAYSISITTLEAAEIDLYCAARLISHLIFGIPFRDDPHHNSLQAPWRLNLL